MNKNDHKIEAVVMAAGMGTRLGTHSNNLPKALVEVGSKPLIGWVLEGLKLDVIKKITVVGGYQFDMLEGYLKENHPEVTILKNENYKEGNILSLKKAIPKIQGSFLLCNVDHIYPADLLKKFTLDVSNIKIACDQDRKLGLDDMKVLTGKEKKLGDISKKLDEFDMGYIGMTICSESKLSDYKKAVDDVIEQNGRSAVVENVLKYMASSGDKIDICDCSGWKWYEVDTPDELESANLALRRGV
ncbi:MAG: NTP transferase domain-containing protein [Pseudomonadota bacterium]